MINKKLKILIPIISFGRAGGIRVLTQLANHWSSMGHEITFLTFFESENPYYPVSEKVTILWIGRDGFDLYKNIENYKPKNSMLKRMIAIYRYLKRNSKNFDLVLANASETSWPIWFASRTLNFYYIQAYEVEFNLGKGLRKRIKRIFSYFSYFLPLKRIVNADIYKKYKNIRSTLVIPPGLDFSLYYPKESSNTEENKIFTVGCIGRKAVWKGSDDVGEAVKIIRSRGYNVHFKVAFEPISYLEHDLVKPDGDKNLSDFYRSLDVLVAPGHIQLGAFHYPVIEAMACKTPVITTGYYPANPENSFIVPIKRPDLIADIIVEMLENYANASSKAEIALSQIKEFDWFSISSKFISIFSDVIEEKNK